MDEAISLDKTIKKKSIGLGRTAKHVTNSRYLSESRLAGASEYDMRSATDAETIRLQMYNIERKLQQANIKRENKNKE